MAVTDHSPHLGMEPDTATGTFQGCDCDLCRERRLADDRHAMYTPHDMCDAWQSGYADGWAMGYQGGIAAGAGKENP
jgi:hypothetical protein